MAKNVSQEEFFKVFFRRSWGNIWDKFKNLISQEALDEIFRFQVIIRAFLYVINDQLELYVGIDFKS